MLLFNKKALSKVLNFDKAKSSIFLDSFYFSLTFLFPRKTVARFPELSGKRNLALGDEFHYQRNKEYSDKLEIHIDRIN